MIYRLFAAALALLVLTGGCIDSETSPEASKSDDLQRPQQVKKNKQEKRMARDNTKLGGIVELSAFMLKPAIDDLSSQLNVSPSDIQVLRATPVTWNDGSVGCPQPEVAYTQALVPGYWVVLEHTGNRYSYHATGNSTFRICENALPDPTGKPPYGRLNEDI